MAVSIRLGINLGGRTITADNVPDSTTISFVETQNIIQTINGNYISEYMEGNTVYVGVYYNDTLIGNLYTYDTTSGKVFTDVTLPEDYGIVNEVNYDAVFYPYISRNTDANIYAYTEDLNKVDIKGTVIFPDVLFNAGIPSGTFPKKYTLSKSAANYSHMKIYFATNNKLYNTIELYQPNGKTAYLMSGNTNGDPKFYIKYSGINISGTSINVINNSSGTVRINPTPTQDPEVKVCIVRVEAWN